MNESKNIQNIEPVIEKLLSLSSFLKQQIVSKY